MKNIGLVLSGGMGKGAYQIGALLAISEYFKPSDFKYVSAASIGVLNAYAFVTDNLIKATNIWRTVNIESKMKFVPQVMKSSMLKDIVSDIVCNRKITNSFYVPLLDIAKRELNYFDLSTISLNEMEAYLRAAISLPLYNKGIKIGDRTLYDGALVDNIPIHPLCNKNLDYIICIYFDKKNYVFEDSSLDNKVIKLTFDDKTVISNSLVLTHSSVEYMIEQGYRSTKKELSCIFDDNCKLDIICSRIKEKNENVTDKILRITGDIVVNNMNRIVKKVVKRKLIEKEDGSNED